jgi:hypothetical protein
VEECSNSGTATDLDSWNVHNRPLKLENTRTAARRSDDTTRLLCLDRLGKRSGLLSLDETLKALLLALERSGCMCSTKSKLTIKVSGGVRGRTKVVGRGHSVGYEEESQKNRKSVLTARHQTSSCSRRQMP